MALGPRLCSLLLFRFLRGIRRGQLELRLPDGSVRRFGAPDAEPRARLEVCDGSFFTDVILRGDIGFGESYTRGAWTSPDLTRVIEVFALNLDTADDRSILLSRLGRLINRLRHRARRNTREQSRANIRDHYDLSNDFFSTFLDPTMTYSSAVFAAPDQPLQEAQLHKLGAIMTKADLRPGDHVLEIGSGWGSFAIESSRRTGCTVTSITLSEEQLKLARARAEQAGVADRVSFHLRDYRDMQGRFDKIVSIEMLEAVGHEFLDGYFQTLARLLKPGGRAVIQVITIPHTRYDAYRRGCDWVQKHVFPGGHLPSVEVLRQAVEKTGALTIEHLEAIGGHYVGTLRSWREQFVQNLPAVRDLGFDEEFCRKWEYYLSYCEAGFATGAIDNVHLVLSRSHEA